MRLLVTYSDRASCYVALHPSDASLLFGSVGTARHFCRVLRLDRADQKDGKGVPRVFVGWVGEAALAPGTLEIARPFAACLGLCESENVTGSAATDVPVAPSVMVQPHSTDDWEVVELQASFIEEHLLAQIAVLMPGMIFTVWIHGQMPVRLRVDLTDSNRAECFLLDRNSELVIESKKRAYEDRPVSIFGREASKAFGPAGQADGGLRLRVLIAAPAGGAHCTLDGPAGRVHSEDLEQLVGYAAPHGCLAWLLVCDSAHTARVAEGLGRHRSSGPQLLRVEADTAVPRRHIVIGTCLAKHAQVPRFSMAQLWRCRQVPVYVPHIELVPLGPWRHDACDDCHTEEDSSWLLERFTAFVRRCGEVDLMDGAVVRLQSSIDLAADCAALADMALGGRHRGPRGQTPEKVPSSSSEVTDLYEGLSDIDDIYQQSPTVECEVTWAGLGVYEVDLGLEEEPSLPAPWLVTANPGSGHNLMPAASPPLARRPESIPVRVSFALGAAREDLRSACTPPFVRLTVPALSNGLKVAPAWPSGGHQAADASASVLPQADPLETLWTAVPGLQRPPEEGLQEVLRLVAESESSTPLDGLALFAEAAASLRQRLLTQLGCHPSADSAAARRGRGLGLELLGPCVPGFAVTGATAVIGTTGTGKTTLCRRVLAELGVQGILPLEVACAKLGQPSRKFRALQDFLQEILRFACWYSPSVVLLDDLGALCPDVEPGAMNLSIAEERSPILAEQLLDLLPEIAASGARVALVATLAEQSAVHQKLWRYPAVEHKVPLRPPQMKERPEILQILCRQRAKAGWDVDAEILREGALDEWGGRVDGFSVADLARLVDSACIEATVEASSGLLQGNSSAEAWCDQRRLLMRHLERACQDFVPAMMADQSFFASDIRMADIGGLEGPKQALLDMLTMPTRFGVLFDRAPVRGRKGLMLVGPPGCGKTMLVHAAANETKGLLRFLTVKGPELLSKYIGASEAGVRQVFERAAAAAPSVIFFDEIEALAPRRGADSTGVTDRVVNQMLCYLDGVEDRGRVYVVAATGRPDLVDAALLRPGRFDKICYCGLPSDEEKMQICEILAKRHGLVSEHPCAELGPQLRRLVSRLPRLFTCADLTALFASARIEAVNEALHGAPSVSAVTSHKPVMSMGHLYEALSTAKASVSEADERRYTKIFAAYRGAQPSAMSLGAAERQQPGQKVALA